MKEGLLKDTNELIIKEIQTILTVFYITIVGIGMLFKFQKFSEFDINIFNYADVFDFLIAPFSDFHILLFTIASTFFVFIIIKLDTLMKNKCPEFYSKVNFGLDKKSWYKTYRIVGFIITFIFYLYMSANYYGKYTKEKIINQNDVTIKLVDNELQSGKLIGQTKDIIFLLKDENVYIIPITSLVKEIKIN